MQKNNNEKSIKVLIFSLFDVLILSFGHAFNISSIILFALVIFTVIVLVSPKPTFFPIMLFFLPWSTIMKFSYGSFSFYTIIVPVFFMFVLLTINKTKEIFQVDNVLISCIFVSYTMIVKLVLGYSISMSYVFIMMMMIFMPTYLSMYKNKLSFEWCIIFFSTGIISAGVASKFLLRFPHMLQFIDVYEWKSVGLTRLSGFYGDANYYSAQILVAISGLLIIAVNKNAQKAAYSLATVFVLIYFGFLSVSKMFLIVLLVIVGLWIFAIVPIRGKLGIKISSFLCVGIGILIILKTGIFKDELNMYLIRFGMVNNASTLTTGRIDIYSTYIEFFKGNISSFLFGQGYTEVLAGNIKSAAHNTIIQALYQLGCLGISLIILWIRQVSRAVKGVKNTSLGIENMLFIYVLIFACFVPWLSLDILFFDEFFYITSLFFLGKSYICSFSEHTQLRNN